MTRNKWFLLVASVAALSLVAAACGDDDGGGGTATGCAAGDLQGYALGAPKVDTADVTAAGLVRPLAQAKPVVKIGMFGDLTGANSGLVTPVRDAAKLAVKQRNAAGDLQVQVQLVVKDNKDADPTTAPPIEQGFIDDDAVVGVIGGAFSGETAAVGEKFDQAGLTHVTASATNPDLTTHGWPFFRAVVTDDIQGAKMAGLLDTLGCKTAAVIDDTGDYGKGLADFVAKGLTDGGVEVVVRESVAADTADYAPLVDTISAASPDVVFYGGYYNAGSALLKQMRESGLDSTFACGDGCVDNQFVSLAGADNAKGAVFTCPCVIPALAPADEKATELNTAYQAEYKKPALIYSAEAYDAANIFLDAIAAADDDGEVTRAEVLKFVQDLEGYDGVSRTYTFDDTGELDASAAVINVYPVGSDGKLSLLGTTDEVA